MAAEFIPWHGGVSILGRKTNPENATATARHWEDEGTTLDNLKASRFGGQGSRCRVGTCESEGDRTSESSSHGEESTDRERGK